MSEEAIRNNPPKVVIYRSAITDIRTVEARLRRADLDFEVEVMSMASQDERKRYRELKQSSGYGTLPLVYINDACIGGEPELARYIAERRDQAVPTPSAGDPDDPTPQAQAPPAAVGEHRAPTQLTAVEEAPASSAPENESQAPSTGEDAEQALRRRTALLGYGGLIPFAACAVASFVGPLTSLASLALVAYAAVIFSFVGAVHWGYSLGQDPRHPRGLVASVVPSLIAWVAVVLHVHVGAVAGLALLAGSFVLWHVFERVSARLPRHYLALRLRLTSAVAAILAGTCVAHAMSIGTLP